MIKGYLFNFSGGGGGWWEIYNALFQDNKTAQNAFMKTRTFKASKIAEKRNLRGALYIGAKKLRFKI